MGACDIATHPILVVDDEDDLTETYERLLRRNGYRVVSATSCREGLDAIGHHRFALVVADLSLPDGDGLDLVRAARAATPPMPVIVVTGFTSQRRRRAAKAAGAEAYLPKPFEASAFTSLVDTVLMRS
jgi:DNA-binding response OmpR family regulator